MDAPPSAEATQSANSDGRWSAATAFHRSLAPYAFCGRLMRQPRGLRGRNLLHRAHAADRRDPCATHDVADADRPRRSPVLVTLIDDVSPLAMTRVQTPIDCGSHELSRTHVKVARYTSRTAFALRSARNSCRATDSCSCVYFPCVSAALRTRDVATSDSGLAVRPQPEATHWGRRRWLLLAVFITYSLAYLDRANYGFGAAAGMAKTLGITGS